MQVNLLAAVYFHGDGQAGCSFYTKTPKQAPKTTSEGTQNLLKNAKFSIRRLYRYNPNTQTDKA